MPNLSIKNVPDEVVTGLRERAAANHRSLQGELLALVSQSVATEPKASVAAFESVQGIRKGHKSIEQIAAEHQQNRRRPGRKGPQSTALIRQERDAR
jgi:plasmid stability protein